jgi:hypothetical protein
MLLFGVAVVATSIILSAITAVIVEGAYEAIANRRWPELQPLPVIVVLSVAAGFLVGSTLG